MPASFNELLLSKTSFQGIIYCQYPTLKGGVFMESIFLKFKNKIISEISIANLTYKNCKILEVFEDYILIEINSDIEVYKKEIYLNKNHIIKFHI